MEPRGILDLDLLCLQKILKFLPPLDVWSMRQSCTQMRDFADDHCRSLYFASEQWLDIREENIRNVNRILTNFGKFVRRLKVGENNIKPNLLLDVIATNCVLEGLSLHNLNFYKIDIEKFTEFFNRLEILELINCRGDPKSIENILLVPEYVNLTTLKEDSHVEADIYRKFFMRPRNIKKLSGGFVHHLDLIALNAVEMEDLEIYLTSKNSLMSLVQLKKLKRLKFCALHCDESSIIALINALAVNNQLEMIGIFCLTFFDTYFNALSKLTNLKELRLMYGINSNSKSLAILGEKLPKLESLTLRQCQNFPYRNFLSSACKSDKFRTLYVSLADITGRYNFIEHIVKDFIDGRAHRCFVSGNPLCVYLEKTTFDNMEELLTEENLKLIKKHGNIRILRANGNVFCSWL